MNRRKFVLGCVSGGAVVAGGAWVGFGEGPEKLDIDTVFKKLDGLMSQQLTAMGEWSLYQIFTHCAQSVEYSMTGYPEHKPAAFKQTVGKGAFAFFNSKHKMKHPLNEVIPGAPSLPVDGNLESAVTRLRQSLQDFINYNETLAPHFAYGELTKSEYEKAHVMHFNNHLEEIMVS